MLLTVYNLSLPSCFRPKLVVRTRDWPVSVVHHDSLRQCEKPAPPRRPLWWRCRAEWSSELHRKHHHHRHHPHTHPTATTARRNSHATLRTTSLSSEPSAHERLYSCLPSTFNERRALFFDSRAEWNDARLHTDNTERDGPTVWGGMTGTLKHTHILLTVSNGSTFCSVLNIQHK